MDVEINDPSFYQNLSNEELEAIVHQRDLTREALMSGVIEKINDIEDSVFVAILLPNGDGSGRSKILGVYLDKEKAEARCYRETVKTGGQPLAIIKCIVDQDREED